MVPATAIGDGVGRGMGPAVEFPRAAVRLSVREPAHVYVTSSELELLVRLRTASKVSNVNGSDALTSMAVVLPVPMRLHAFTAAHIRKLTHAFTAA